ncbi:zinc ribbon domain-containing protein [Patescibacteria group bacterium]|nr:zinc ribbon domain-containing protein [Patescibacteria group bacterium]
MFKVREATTVEHRCPNGHNLLLNPRSENDQSVKFCHLCGASLEEQQAPYHAAYCANCNNPVYPDWNYCPFCGQGREENRKEAE